MDDERARTELRHVWERELVSWWRHYNDEFIGGALTPPVIVVSAATETLGSWDHDTRMLCIAERHVERAPWSEVMSTLRHEMAHQYVDEVLHAEHEPPHGPAFAHASKQLRVEPHSGPQDAPEPRIVGVVRKLLALSSSPNEHEAAAAMRKAHALLAAYNIENLDHDGPRGFVRRELGNVSGRHHAWEYTLSLILVEFFFVEVIWTGCYDAPRQRRGTVLVIYGTPANIELATYAHDFLSWVIGPLFESYKAEAGLSGNRERLRYFDGVLRGFRKKLENERDALREERGLVWLGDPALDRWFRWHNPRVHTSTYGSGRRSQAFKDGLRDGNDLTMHKPIGRSSGRVRGHLE